MPHPLTLSALVLAFLAPASFAQEDSNLQARMPDIESKESLSQTLLDFSANSHVNVVADTTSNERDPDADLITQWPKAQKVAWVLNKQSLVFGYYWNQVDPNTVVVWHKPDVKALARTIAEKWGQQTGDDQLPPKIEAYLLSVAQKIDREGGADKRTQDITASFEFSALPPEERDLVLPLILRAQHTSALKYDQYWLSDDLWGKAAIGNTGTAWTVGAPLPTKEKNMVRSAAHEIPQHARRSPSVWSEDATLASAAENAQLGSRFEGQAPVALTVPVTLTAENLPVVQTLKQLSDACGVALNLDEAALAQVKDKRLTITATGVSPMSLLRDVALLYDLKWKVDGAKVTASPNDDTFQNAVAKVACLPNLDTWDSQRDVTQPDWNTLLLQETSVAKARAKGGVPFKTLSPELQSSFRAYNESIESYRILTTWQRTLEPLPQDLKISFRLSPMSQRRNATPLPDPPLTPEEARDPQTMAQYNAAYYESYRPFTVTISSERFDARYDFTNGILAPPIAGTTP